MRKTHQIKIILVLAMASILCGGGPVFAVVRYVRSNATGANNGTNWTDAYISLQSGLAATVSGDEIWVATRTYKPTTNGDRNATFQVQKGVSLYGGFTGTETMREQRNCKTNVTPLSGDPNGDGGYSGTHYAGSSCHAATAIRLAFGDGAAAARRYLRGMSAHVRWFGETHFACGGGVAGQGFRDPRGRLWR